MSTSNISRIGNLEIFWEEFTRESLSSFHQSLFKLVDACRRDLDCEYDPKSDTYADIIADDTIIIMKNLKYCNNDGNRLVSVELKSLANFFISQNENAVIIAELELMQDSKFHIEEEYFPISDEITTRNYQVSNHGNILDEEGEQVPQIYFDDGPRVFIPSDDNVAYGYYYSVPLIMTKTFNPILEAGENTKMVKRSAELTDLRRSLEFVSFQNIHDEFNHVLTIPFLYTGYELGESISKKLRDINNSF